MAARDKFESSADRCDGPFSQEIHRPPIEHRLSHLTRSRRCPTIEWGRAMRWRTDRIESTTRWAGFFLFLGATAVLSVSGQQDASAGLDAQFTRTVRPFLETYCIACHGQQQPAAQLDLSRFTTTVALMHDERHWTQMLARLEANEMPPKGVRQPTPQERRTLVDW